MPIKTSIPSNLRKPGTYAEFDVTSAARGLVPLAQRVALIGAKLPAGTKAVSTPAQVYSDKDADDFFGKGSELALMCRAALRAAARYGASPELWAVAVADAAGAVKATKTMTVAGPATSAGDVIARIAGRTIRAAVAKGDTPATVAAALRDAINAKAAEMPVVATVGGAGSEIVTLTANNGGPNGNDIKAESVSNPAGITVTVGPGTPGSGAYDIQPALDVLVDKRYHAIAVATHVAGDVTKLKTHIDTRGASGVKHWSMAYMAETGTLSTATTLATGANYKEIVVVSAEDFPNLPGEIAAHVATTIEAEGDPAHNFDGQELDLVPPAAASVPTNTEIETALGAGAMILTVADTLDRAKIVRFVTTKTTEAGAAFESLLDGSNVRALFFTAAQVDERLKLVLKGAKKNAQTKARVKSVVLDTLRKLEEIEVLQNVEQHIGEIQVADDPLVPTRLNVGVPASIVPNLHQLASVFTLYLE